MAAAGAAGSGSVGAGVGFTGVVGGAGRGAGFGWTTCGTGVACVVLEVAVVLEAAVGGVARCSAAWLGCFALIGACTTLEPGPGPSAMPREVAGEASRRGINAPPAMATASSSPAIMRSFRLMFSPFPADNFPENLSARGEIGLRVWGPS